MYIFHRKFPFTFPFQRLVLDYHNQNADTLPGVSPRWNVIIVHHTFDDKTNISDEKQPVIYF